MLYCTSHWALSGGAKKEKPTHGRENRRSWFTGAKLFKLSVKTETFRSIALANIFTYLTK